MPKEDNRRCIVCHHGRGLLNSPVGAVCVHEVTHVRDRIDSNRRREQERRGTRLAGRVGSAAPKPVEAEPLTAASVWPKWD